MVVRGATDPNLCLSYGAFYGDAELKDLFISRLRRMAADHHLLVSRFARRDGNSATPALAMAGGPETGLFELRTGLPYPVGLVLDFLQIDNSNGIDRSIGQIKPGTDINALASRFVLNWLCDDRLPWTKIIQRHETAVFRDKWAAATRSFLETGVASFDRILCDANELMPAYVEIKVDKELLNLIVDLSPVPANLAIIRWKGIVTGLCWSLAYSLASVEAGWTHDDRDYEVRTMNFFRARCPDPTNKEEIEKARAEWMQDNKLKDEAHSRLLDKLPGPMASVAAISLDIFSEAVRAISG